MSYLELAKQVEAKLQQDPFNTTPKNQKTPLETTALRQAYRAIWSLSEDAPVEAYASAWKEIQCREQEVPPEVALRVLREEAQGFYERTGQCPFCRGPELHLPPVSLEELGLD